MKTWISNKDITLNNGNGISALVKAGVECSIHPALHAVAIANGVKEVKAKEEPKPVVEAPESKPAAKKPVAKKTKTS